MRCLPDMWSLTYAFAGSVLCRIIYGYRRFDQVELTHEMMSCETLGEPLLLREGQRGQVMEIYFRPELGFDVEFFDDNGNTIAVTIVHKSDIRPRGNQHDKLSKKHQ